MNQWAFVIAAYGVAGVATVGLTIVSYVRMRRAEAAADALRRR